MLQVQYITFTLKQQTIKMINIISTERWIEFNGELSPIDSSKYDTAFVTLTTREKGKIILGIKFTNNDGDEDSRGELFFTEIEKTKSELINYGIGQLLLDGKSLLESICLTSGVEFEIS